MTVASVDVHFERREFYNWVLANRPSVTLQAYWNLLMEFNNRAAIESQEGIWYWPVAFTLPNSQVATYLNLKNRQVVGYYRQDLIRMERLAYTPGKGRGCGRYALRPFNPELLPVVIQGKKSHRSVVVWSQRFLDFTVRKAVPHV